MFVGSVDFENGTALELVVVPLKGSELQGQWEKGTELLMLCVVQNGRCCTCSPTDHHSRFEEKLGLPAQDAKLLAEWLKVNLAS